MRTHGFFDTAQAANALNLRICFVGDSIINGTGDLMFRGWPSRVMELVNKECHVATHYNLGIRGNTSVDVSQRWQAETDIRIQADHKGHLIFGFGVNDCVNLNDKRRVDPETTLNTTYDILQKAKSRWPVLFIGPAPIDDTEINQRIGILSKGLSEVCRSVGVPFLSTFSTLSLSPIWMEEVKKIDGAHPGAKGYGELARLVSEWKCWKEWFA